MNELFWLFFFFAVVSLLMVSFQAMSIQFLLREVKRLEKLVELNKPPF